MYPELIKVGPITLNSYGVMITLGFLVCGYLMQGELSRILDAAKRKEGKDYPPNTSLLIKFNDSHRFLSNTTTDFSEYFRKLSKSAKKRDQSKNQQKQ